MNLDLFDKLDGPYGWPGAKNRSIDSLNKYIPNRRIWVDVCGGSGIVTLNRTPSPIEVFNDLDQGVVAFWRSLRDNHKRLQERLHSVLYSREEFQWCRDTWQKCDSIEQAARWYCAIRMSYNSVGKLWKRDLPRDTDNRAKCVNGFYSKLNSFIRYADRFKNITIENLHALKVIEKYQTSDAVFYIDPQYIGAVKLYNHQVPHKSLLDLIQSCKGLFAVSNYANELYDSYKWDARYTWSAKMSMAQKDSEEVLWIKNNG